MKNRHYRYLGWAAFASVWALWIVLGGVIVTRTWSCFFGRHRWSAWRHWSDDRPVIVRSSLECMNDPTVVRECVVCGAYGAANPYKTTGVPIVHARNLVA